MAGLRYLAAAGFVALVTSMRASCSGKPWWAQTGSSACGPPALVRVAGQVLGAGNCAAQLTIPALRVTVHVGQQIDVHMLAGPVPQSSRRSVLVLSALGPGRSTGAYLAIHPGRAAVISRTWPCLVAGHHPPKVMTGNCPVIEVTVVR